MESSQLSAVVHNARDVNITGGDFLITHCPTHHHGNSFASLARNASPNAFYDSQAERYREKCHPRTREATLNTIKAWASRRAFEDKPIMWLFGPAGGGKTAVMKSIAEYCQAEKRLIGEYLFMNSDGTRNHNQSLAATIAYRMSTLTFQHLKPSVVRAFEDDPLIMSSTLDSQLTRLILQPLEVHRSSFSVPDIIIIDGLDECGNAEQQREVLEAFLNVVESYPWLKVLIASRPEAQIQHTFNSNKFVTVTKPLSLTNDPKSNADIHRYLVEKFAVFKSNLRRPPTEDWPPENVVDLIVKKCSGQFILAATIYQYVASPKRPHQAVHRLESVASLLNNQRTNIVENPFAAIDAMYAFILTSCDNSTLAVRFAGTCLLSSDVFGAATHELVAGVLDKPVDDILNALDDLSSIFGDDQKNIWSFHVSFGDYLFDKSRSGKLWCDRGDIVADLLCYVIRNEPSKGYYIQLRPLFHQANENQNLMASLAKLPEKEDFFRPPSAFDIQQGHVVLLTGIHCMKPSYHAAYKEIIDVADNNLMELLTSVGRLSPRHDDALVCLHYMPEVLLESIFNIDKNDVAYRFFQVAERLLGLWHSLEYDMPKTRAIRFDQQRILRTTNRCINFLTLTRSSWDTKDAQTIRMILYLVNELHHPPIRVINKLLPLVREFQTIGLYGSWRSDDRKLCDSTLTRLLNLKQQLEACTHNYPTSAQPSHSQTSQIPHLIYFPAVKSHPRQQHDRGMSHPLTPSTNAVSPQGPSAAAAAPGPANGVVPPTSNTNNAAEEGTWLKNGRDAEKRGDLDCALSAYENALRHNPASVFGLTQAAGIARKQENYSKAIDFSQRLLQIEDGNSEIWIALGHCYMMLDDVHKAYSAYQQALYFLSNPTSDLKFWYSLGVLYHQCGHLSHAVEAFTPVHQCQDLDFDKENEILFRLGIIYKQQGKFNEALNCFKKNLQNPPSPLTHADVWFQIGHIFEQQKNHLQARDTYKRVIESNPYHAKVLRQLGWLYHQDNSPLQNQDTAIQYLTKSVEADPSDAQSWYLLGRAYMAGQKYEQAYEGYQQAVYRDGQNPTFWCSIGILYFQINQFHDALDAYSRAININPSISEVWFNLGSLYEACNNQITDAIDAYTHAAKLDPGNVIIMQRLQLLENVQATGNQLPTAPGQNVNPTAYTSSVVPPPSSEVDLSSSAVKASNYSSPPVPFQNGLPPLVILDESPHVTSHISFAPMDLNPPPHFNLREYAISGVSTQESVRLSLQDPP